MTTEKSHSIVKAFIASEENSLLIHMDGLKRQLDSMENHGTNVSHIPSGIRIIHGGFIPGCYYTKEDFVREINRVRELYIYIRHLPWEYKKEKVEQGIDLSLGAMNTADISKEHFEKVREEETIREFENVHEAAGRPDRAEEVREIFSACLLYTSPSPRDS